MWHSKLFWDGNISLNLILYDSSPQTFLGARDRFNGGYFFHESGMCVVSHGWYFAQFQCPSAARGLWTSAVYHFPKYLYHIINNTWVLALYTYVPEKQIHRPHFCKRSLIFAFKMKIKMRINQHAMSNRSWPIKSSMLESEGHNQICITASLGILQWLYKLKAIVTCLIFL